MKKLKCLKCPYRLGEVKCFADPCKECLESNSKKPPFPEAVIKEIKNVKNKH